MKTIGEQIKEMGFLEATETELYKAYNEALKNKNFSELVSKLSFSRSELIKYTSLLMECAVDYSNCQKCSNLMQCKNRITGYAYSPLIIDKNIQFGYMPCTYQKKYLKETKHLSNVYMFDIPLELKRAKMSDIYKDDESRYPLILWLNDFQKSYLDNPKQKGLYLHGSFGSGKTYLLAALFNELAKSNIKSSIVYWPEFLRDLKSSFTTDFGEKFNYIKKTPLLLIDDIGAEVVTEWGRDEILGPILQYRMQEQLPTFFTSNFDLKTLEKHLSNTKGSVSNVKGRRIIERIMQLTEDMKIVSKNLRK